jgi:hypothetical protein
LTDPDAHSQGYQAVPSSYGATNGAPNNGLQTLGADPTKIEPKVRASCSALVSRALSREEADSIAVALQAWLASERTFLNWLRVALLLSSFALALFNSASAHDHVAKWMGFSYAVIAVGMIGYAWIMQNRRRHRIVTRYGGHHGEPSFGPPDIGQADPSPIFRRDLRTRRRRWPHLPRCPRQLHPPRQAAVRSPSRSGVFEL